MKVETECWLKRYKIQGTNDWLEVDRRGNVNLVVDDQRIDLEVSDSMKLDYFLAWADVFTLVAKDVLQDMSES